MIDTSKTEAQDRGKGADVARDDAGLRKKPGTLSSGKLSDAQRSERNDRVGDEPPLQEDRGD